MRAAGRPATNREFPDDAGAAPRGMCLATASQSGTSWPRPRRVTERPAPASSFARRNVKINIAVRSPRPHAAATQRKEAGLGAKRRGRPARASLHARRENDRAYGGAGCDGRRHGNPEAAGDHTKGNGKDIRKIARGRGKDAMRSGTARTACAREDWNAQKTSHAAITSLAAKGQMARQDQAVRDARLNLFARVWEAVRRPPPASHFS